MKTTNNGINTDEYFRTLDGADRLVTLAINGKHTYPLICLQRAAQVYADNGMPTWARVCRETLSEFVAKELLDSECDSVWNLQHDTLQSFTTRTPSPDAQKRIAEVWG